MILTVEQAEQRVNSENNLLEVIKRRHGSSIHRTTEEQVEIAVQARLEPYKKVAEEHNISVSQVSNLVRGQTGPQVQPKEELVEKTEAKLREVRESAVDKLIGVIGLITEEKLSGNSAKDLANVASNLSKIISNTAPASKSTGPAVQVILYAPNQKKLDDYKVIEVNS